MRGLDADWVYLSPAPLYHAAPLLFATVAAAVSATAIIMERFDAEDFLRLVQQHRVPHHVTALDRCDRKVIQQHIAARRQGFANHASTEGPRS
jgi:acyl-CoA synthetase (AMP-forming)/AMP-acid ligase II